MSPINFGHLLIKCATGEAEIANTWCNTFQQLYNSVNGGGARDKFYNRFMNMTLSVLVATARSLYATCSMPSKNRNCGGAVGYDSIAMEAVICGGSRLTVYFVFSLICSYFCAICSDTTS